MMGSGTCIKCIFRVTLQVLLNLRVLRNIHLLPSFQRLQLWTKIAVIHRKRFPPDVAVTIDPLLLIMWFMQPLPWPVGPLRHV